MVPVYTDRSIANLGMACLNGRAIVKLGMARPYGRVIVKTMVLPKGRTIADLKIGLFP